MKIIDNFLSEEIYKNFVEALQNEKSPLEIPHDEADHKGLDNVKLWRVEGIARTMFMNELEDQGFIKIDWDKSDFDVRYHVTKAPYYTNFHCDRLSDWHTYDVDYCGMTFFMNADWNPNDGGFFIWKNRWEGTVGEFVEPIANRLIINPNDLPHAVTQITNKEITRHSIQIFINKGYML